MTHLTKLVYCMSKTKVRPRVYELQCLLPLSLNLEDYKTTSDREQEHLNE